MSKITTPETELQFKYYAAAIELKEAAKIALRMLTSMPPESLPFLPQEQQIGLKQIQILLEDLHTAAQELTKQHKPPLTIEQRGYNLADRGLTEYTGDECGKACCGSGACGSCDGCK